MEKNAGSNASSDGFRDAADVTWQTGRSRCEQQRQEKLDRQLSTADGQ